MSCIFLRSVDPQHTMLLLSTIYSVKVLQNINISIIIILCVSSYKESCNNMPIYGYVAQSEP